MKYCILLDAALNEAQVKEVTEDAMLETAYALMHCDSVQLIPLYDADRLPKGYEAVTDENLYDKMKIFNPLASWLYGADEHGSPICNNCVIFKVVGDDFAGMEQSEAQKIADDLNARAEEIYDMTMFKVMTGNP